MVSVLNRDHIDYYLFPTDPAAYNAADKELIAIKESTVSVSEVNELTNDETETIDHFKKRNAMTFFSLDPENTFLVQAIVAQDTKGKDRLLIMQIQLEELEDGTGFGLPVSPLNGEANYWAEPEDNNMVLVRDPGGRIVATYRNEKDKPLRSLMDTSKFPGVFEEGEGIDDEKVSQNPAVFYSLGPESTLNREGKRGQEREVTEWMLLTNDKKNVFSQDEAYGKVARVFKIEQVNLTQDSTTRTLFVQGYIDGPPPVFEGMENPFSVVNYALTSAKEDSFEVVNNVIVGVQSSGSLATEVGTPGPAWDLSLKAGVASSFKVTNNKSVTENTTFQLERDRDGNFSQNGLIRSSEILLTRDAFSIHSRRRREACFQCPSILSNLSGNPS